MRGVVRTVGRGWQQLGRINAFSLSVFACVAIPAQMKEIQIVIDSSSGESVGLRSGSVPAALRPGPACSQPQPWPLGPCSGSCPGLFPAPALAPTLVFGSEQPHVQLKILPYTPFHLEQPCETIQAKEIEAAIAATEAQTPASAPVMGTG